MSSSNPTTTLRNNTGRAANAANATDGSSCTCVKLGTSVSEGPNNNDFLIIDLLNPKNITGAIIRNVYAEGVFQYNAGFFGSNDSSVNPSFAGSFPNVSFGTMLTTPNDAAFPVSLSISGFRYLMIVPYSAASPENTNLYFGEVEVHTADTPADATDFAAVQHSDHNTLSWSNPNNLPCRISYATGLNAPRCLLFSETDLPAGSTTINHTGLTDGLTYYYRHQFVNPLG